MTNQELVDYYVNLLIEQYRTLERARATVGAFVEQAVADQIIPLVKSSYELTTAVGAQLDILGKYVGVSRFIKGLDFTREFFAMPDYSDPDPGSYAGFYAYSDTPIVNFWARYTDFVTVYRMNDAEMLKLIRLKILLNKSDHTLQDIDNIIDEFFGTDCEVIDGEDMTITYAFEPTSTDTFIKIVAFVGALPRPSGAEIIITGV